MNITRKYPINDQYNAVVEVDDEQLILHIENVRKIFFGLIDWSNQYGHTKWFLLDNRPDGSKIYHCYQFRIRACDIEHRNIETFDLESEIAKLYHSVMAIEAENKAKQKFKDYNMNRILDI